MSIPVPVQREVMAALNIYSTEQHAFDPDSIELATTFGAYAGVALANMHLYQAQGQVAEQLQKAMQSRAAIEQAKGILMGQRRCTAEDAFDLLIKISRTRTASSGRRPGLGRPSHRPRRRQQRLCSSNGSPSSNR
jgi:GAF domain-containing protein